MKIGQVPYASAPIRDILTFMQVPLSLYVHIPFCRRRCGYCDFNTYAGMESWIAHYSAALKQEITEVALAAGARLPVGTVFWGGGTPSLLPIEQIALIQNAYSQYYALLSDVEITLEANPGTVSLSWLTELRRLGFNRLSFGMQSANPDELRLLDRAHAPQDVQSAVAWSRQAGFDNLNLDLIYGLPNQRLSDWQNTLSAALQLEPEHLSLYSLIVEPGTPLAAQVESGRLPPPDDDLAADMMDLAAEVLSAAGFVQYEISNFARGLEHSCHHNLQYWRNLPYLGFGAGAHGSAAGWRTANLASIPAYLNALTASPEWPAYPFSLANAERNPIDRWTEVQETLMVGLRLTHEGVSLKGFANRFGVDLIALFGATIDRLQAQGLLEWAELKSGKALRLTSHGCLLGNQVFAAFIGDPEPPLFHNH
ncbi:MAG TPA: radical SAM family heme chaperone HemW [Anaerolineaceae bacterium]|nr:radical SAM family heme chaperone HemW [Anaerolineaceae bacterium]